MRFLLPIIIVVFIGILIISLSFFYFQDSDKNISSNNFIYIVDLIYDSGEINLNELFIKEGFTPDRKIQPTLGYNLQIISSYEEVIYSFNFMIDSNIVYDVFGEESINPTSTNDYQEFSLVFPYFSNADFIRVYDSNNNLKLEIDTKILNCGDGTCQNYEDEFICPQDCLL
tara:strand:- start:1933 stop:2445 length:513 start_codon:yes stop_codon:yes gene_type:complete